MNSNVFLAINIHRGAEADGSLDSSIKSAKQKHIDSFKKTERWPRNEGIPEPTKESLSTGRNRYLSLAKDPVFHRIKPNLIQAIVYIKLWSTLAEESVALFLSIFLVIFLAIHQRTHWTISPNHPFNVPVHTTISTNFHRSITHGFYLRYHDYTEMIRARGRAVPRRRNTHSTRETQPRRRRLGADAAVDSRTRASFPWTV